MVSPKMLLPQLPKFWFKSSPKLERPLNTPVVLALAQEAAIQETAAAQAQAQEVAQEVAQAQ